MILFGEENNKTIRELIEKEAALDCMVAFIGGNATNILWDKSKKVRLICNLESGGTNPYAVEELLKSDNTKIRNQSQLHAKIYIGESQAIISSANLSANGLSLEGEEVNGWLEAGYKVSGTEEVEKLKDHFEKTWDEAEDISDELLNSAKEKWQKRRVSRPVTKCPGSSLLQALKNRAFELVDRNIYFVVSRDAMSEEALKKRIELKKDKNFGGNADCYEGWDDLPENAYFIDLYIGPKLGFEFGGLFKSPENKILIPVDDDHLYICHKIGDIEGYKFSEEELCELKARRNKILSCDESENQEGFYINAFDVCDRIFPERDIKTSDESLRQEFTRLAEECKSIGYTPHDFIKMINNYEISATSTAISLVMKENNRVTSGFTRLWEEKRLDLTVEANIIKEPWSSLFDDDVLNRARRTLKEFEYDLS